MDNKSLANKSNVRIYRICIYASVFCAIVISSLCVIQTALANSCDKSKTEVQKTVCKKWYGNCLGFAHFFLQKAHAPKITSSDQIYSYLPMVQDASGAPAWRGMTLSQLAQQPELKAGMVVHVKVHYNIDKAYQPKEDFHHWFIFMGKDKTGTPRFADSFRPDYTGEMADTFIAGWLRSAYAGSKYTDVHAFYNNAPKAPSGAQPKVAAVYNPW